jgi:hypothetical protein
MLFVDRVSRNAANSVLEGQNLHKVQDNLLKPNSVRN